MDKKTAVIGEFLVAIVSGVLAVLINAPSLFVGTFIALFLAFLLIND